MGLRIEESARKISSFNPQLLHLLSENRSKNTMSWLPNPFKSLQPPDDGEDSAGGTVKEDLSVIGESIGRQFRGVAAFLAPPPSPRASVPMADDDSSDSSSPRLDGIRNDLAEISGSFKSSLSLISSNKAVLGISKLASNFLQLNDEKGEVKEDQAVGMAAQLVDFVTDISRRPYLWTKIPLSLKDHDFTMSDAQAKHISVMEQLVPTIAELKTSLTSHLTERQFWMIYFLVLLPQLLYENSLKILATPEIVELERKLLVLVSTESKNHNENSSQLDSSVISGGMQQSEIEEISEEKENTDPIDAQISFSDLEDDDTDVSTKQYGSGRGQGKDAESSSPDGFEWVRLDESAENARRKSTEGRPSCQSRDSEGEGSSDWLTIDEFDV